MPRSRLSETIGVQRVRVGNKDKTEAWLVKGTSCKYVLVAVFIIVGCFVAAIVATQITFVSEKHKLVDEENAHRQVEVVLEKKILEVGSLLENELRRRLKHTKMSDAVHAQVQGRLEDVDYPAQIVNKGDAEFDALIDSVSNMAKDVRSMVSGYSKQMLSEAERSSKLLVAIAKHLGGEETELLIEDTNPVVADTGKLSKDELAAKVAEDRARSKGKGLKERTKEARARVQRLRDSGEVGHGSAESVLDERREHIREKMKGGKPVMRKAKNLAVRSRSGIEKKPTDQSSASSESKSASASGAAGSDFIQGRDLQSLLVRFFMRLNKIDSVVFPDKVKAELAAIQEKHQDKVAQIEAESSTKREKSQKLRAHWSSTLEELQTVLEEEGVAGVETNELNHAAWMVDELLKEMMNVIDVQDLKESLFALEDQFKSGEDSDAIAVMKQLQKMAREGDLPYEWVFGGSTGLSAEKDAAGGNVHGMMGRPRRRRRQPDDPEGEGEDEEGEFDEDDDDEFEDEDDGGGDPDGQMGMMGGAPQYMWWRDYPRQVDNPHWKPPPGMMDNFEFLDRERDETARRRKEELKHAKEHHLHGPDKDGDGIPDDKDDVDDREFERGAAPPGGRRNHTRGEPRRPRGRRWGEFGNTKGKGKRSRDRKPANPNRKPRDRLSKKGDSNDDDDAPELPDFKDDTPFGGFRVGKRQKSDSNSNTEQGSDDRKPPSRHHPHHRPPPPLSDADEDDYASFGKDEDGSIPKGPPKDHHVARPPVRGPGFGGDDYYSDDEGEPHGPPGGHAPTGGAHQRRHPPEHHKPKHNLPEGDDYAEDAEPRHKPHQRPQRRSGEPGLDIREERD